MEEFDLYLSHFTNRIDAKGRVSIPAPFRAVLARDGYDGLFVHPSVDAEAIDCGGHTLLREIKAVLKTFQPYSEEWDTLSTALMGMSEKLKIDSEGRIALSEGCKIRIGASSEATFVGLGHKFQIWEPQRFRVHLDEAKTKLRDLRKSLGTQGAAVRPPLHGARE